MKGAEFLKLIANFPDFAAMDVLVATKMEFGGYQYSPLVEVDTVRYNPRVGEVTFDKSAVNAVCFWSQ